MKIKIIYLLLAVMLFAGEQAFSQSCNLVQNGSFEVYSTCPIGNGEINKATGWYQGANAGGSSDFFHQTCGFMNVGGGITPLVPFPNGVGCAGVYINYGAPNPYYKEEGAQFLNFCAGQKYKLEIYLAKPASGSYINTQNNFSLQIGNAAVLPTAFTPTTLCAVNFNEVTNVTGSLITSSWQYFSRTFTATQNANAFLFSGSCAGPFTGTAYVFFDNVIISTVDTLTVSPTVISTCDSASFTITIPGGCYGPYDVVINDGTAPDTLFNISSGYVHTVFPVGNTTYTVTSIINSYGCATPLNIPVLVNSGAINNTVNASICSGASYTLPGGSVVTVPGSYKDTLLSAGGCDSIINTQLTVVLPFSATQTLTVCQGDSVMLPGGSYALVPGTYLDSLFTIGGCDSLITTVLMPGAPVTSSQNVSICSGSSYILPGGQSVSIAGTYTDTILSVGGCDSIITTNLSLNNTSTGVQSPAICSGSSFVLPGGTVVTVAGTYLDTLTAANGCDSIVTTNLSVNPSPVVSVSADVTVVSGNSVSLTATGGGTYLWSPSAGLSSATGATVICTPENSQLYCVTVTSASGCTDSACVTVTLDIQCSEMYLPNAFSPNGDNENDVYMAYIHPTCVKEFKLIMYNRFGEKIFETDDVTRGWDGKFRGIMSNPGVYAYYCKAVYTNGKQVLKEGNVSLIR